MGQKRVSGIVEEMAKKKITKRERATEGDGNTFIEKERITRK